MGPGSRPPTDAPNDTEKDRRATPQPSHVPPHPALLTFAPFLRILSRGSVDCWYPPEFFERGAGFLGARRDLDWLTGRPVLGREVLVEAMGAALAAVGARDALS